jgi:hypothetical protein
MRERTNGVPPGEFTTKPPELGGTLLDHSPGLMALSKGHPKLGLRAETIDETRVGRVIDALADR